ncbi:unnamed protein product [Symbiodinium sp. KB8]|nr:unnamed protein product [Symbiodinium sp. KB8]
MELHCGGCGNFTVHEELRGRRCVPYIAERPARTGTRGGCSWGWLWRPSSSLQAG